MGNRQNISADRKRGVSPISTNLYLRRGTVEGLLKNKDFLFLNMILTLNCLNPVHRQGDGAPVFFHLSCEQIGPVAVDHVAEAAIGLREKSGFHNAGFIFKG